MRFARHQRFYIVHDPLRVEAVADGPGVRHRPFDHQGVAAVEVRRVLAFLGDRIQAEDRSAVGIEQPPVDRASGQALEIEVETLARRCAEAVDVGRVGRVELAAHDGSRDDLLCLDRVDQAEGIGRRRIRRSVDGERVIARGKVKDCVRCGPVRGGKGPVVDELPGRSRQAPIQVCVVGDRIEDDPRVLREVEAVLVCFSGNVDRTGNGLRGVYVRGKEDPRLKRLESDRIGRNAVPVRPV